MATMALHRVGEKSGSSTGDNVMAELQSKLRGRGRIEPSNGSRKGPCSPSRQKASTLVSKSPKKVTAIQTITKPENPVSSKSGHGPHVQKNLSIIPKSSPPEPLRIVEAKNSPVGVKQIKLNLGGDVSPTSDGPNKSPSGKYHPTVIKVDITEKNHSNASLSTVSSKGIKQDERTRSCVHSTSRTTKPPLPGNATNRKPNSKPFKKSVSGGNIKYGIVKDDSKSVKGNTVPVQTGGVRELARIFSVKSKEQSAMETAKNKTPPVSPVKVSSSKNHVQSSLQTKNTHKVKKAGKVCKEKPVDEHASLVNSLSEISNTVNTSMVCDEHMCQLSNDKCSSVNHENESDNWNKQPLSSDSCDDNVTTALDTQEQTTDCDSVTKECSSTPVHTRRRLNTIVQRYQNVFDDEWFVKISKPKPTPLSSKSFEKSSKKPVPTPRKISLSAEFTSSIDEKNKDDEGDDGYEPMASFVSPENPDTKPEVAVLQKLKCEIDLLQDVVNLPPLGEQKNSPLSDVCFKEEEKHIVSNIHQSAVKSLSHSDVSIKRRNTPKSQRDLRRGVVTDGAVYPEEEPYIAMNSTNSLSLSMELPNFQNSSKPRRSNYYMPVISDASVAPVSSPPSISQPKHNGDIPSNIDPVIAEKWSKWKRSQGSLFAQEMIDFMVGQEDNYYQIPVSRRAKLQRARVKIPELEETWHEYVDIDPPNCTDPFISKSIPNYGEINQINGFPPVPVRPPVPPVITSSNGEEREYMYASVMHAGQNKVFPTKDLGVYSLAGGVGKIVHPPSVPPKSESLLREQGVYPLPSIPASYIQPISLKGKRIGISPLEKSVKAEVGSPVSSPSKSGIKAKNIIRVFRKPKKLKNHSPVITSPKIPMVPPNKRWEGFSDLYSVEKERDHTILERSFSTPNVIDNTSPSSPNSPILLSKSVTSSIESIDPNSKEETFVVRESQPVALVSEKFKMTAKCERFRRRKHSHYPLIMTTINRDSLALIFHNRALISEELSKHSNGEMSLRDNDIEEELSPKRGKETLIRCLGEILLEINDILSKSSSDDAEVDLITSIEKQFSLNLRSSNSSCDQCSEKKWHEGIENPLCTTSSSLNSSSGLDVRVNVEDVDFTDEDVQSVVDYVDNCCSDDTPEEVKDTDSKNVCDKQSIFRRSFSESNILNAPDNRLRTESVSSIHSNYEDMRLETVLDSEESQSITVSQLSNGRLQRTNARRRPSAAAEDIIVSNMTTSNSVAYFTYKGGTLSNKDSGVVVEIPEGAVSKGKRQKLWFDVLQTTYKEGEDGQLLNGVGLSSSFASVSDLELDNYIRKKKEGTIQLSSTVLVGPCSAILNKPVKLYIPHCAPLDNAAWTFKVVGRAENCQSDDWVSLTPSGFIASLPGQKQKDFKGSTYQVQPNYCRVKTKQLGCFRLIGKPVGQNISKTSKKMVCSIYCQDQLAEKRFVRVKLFFVNALFDSVEVLDTMLVSEGFTCIERNIPVMCYGNQNDMKVSLLTDSDEGRISISTQTIPFATLWRVTRIGQARAVFDLYADVLQVDKVFTFKINQCEDDSQDIEFMLP